MPIALLYVFAQVFAEEPNSLDAAVALVTQVDAYLRPSEVCNLKWQSISFLVRHVGKAYNKVAIVIGDSALGERTKTKESDDTVILGLPTREWVPDVLQSWRRHANDAASPYVFPDLTLAR